MASIPTRVMLVVAALTLAPTFAGAQDCPGPFEETFQGSLWYGESNTFAVDLLPCQTVSFAISTTSPQNGALLGFKLLNDANVQLLYESWASYGSANHSVPSIHEWDTPYRGTRGHEGLPVTAELSASVMGWQVYSYTIVMTKLPRPGYNQGGTSFSNAPLIVPGVTQYGNLHEDEPGQFYKIHLDAGQSVFVNGEAMSSPQFGALFSINLYDATQQWITTLVNAGGYGSLPFPAQVANPTVYTNPGGSGDFYLRAQAGVWPILDFHFVVGSSDTVPCGFTLTPGSVTWPADGGTGHITVTASHSTCAWTAVTDAEWLTSGTTFSSGSGDATYHVDVNDTGVPRTTVISIAGFDFTVTQTAQFGGSPTDGPPGGAFCTYTLSTRSIMVYPIGGLGAISIFTQPGCAWSIASDAPWLHFDAQSGTGTTRFVVAVDPFPWGSAPRDATTSIARQPIFIVYQVSDVADLDPAATDDTDRDGLPDALEASLARRFIPKAWLDVDQCSAPLSPFKPVVYHARPIRSGLDGVVYYDWVVINYVFLYSEDCGSVTGHPGDAEGIMVFLHRDPSGQWQRDMIAARAHHNSAGDDLTFTSGSEVYASQNRHAFYTTIDECNGLANSCAANLDMAPLALLINAGEQWVMLNNDLGTVYSPWAGQYIWSFLGLLGGDAVILQELWMHDFLPLGLNWQEPTPY